MILLRRHINFLNLRRENLAVPPTSQHRRLQEEFFAVLTDYFETLKYLSSRKDENKFGIHGALIMTFYLEYGIL